MLESETSDSTIGFSSSKAFISRRFGETWGESFLNPNK